MICSYFIDMWLYIRNYTMYYILTIYFDGFLCIINFLGVFRILLPLTMSSQHCDMTNVTQTCYFCYNYYYYYYYYYY